VNGVLPLRVPYSSETIINGGLMHAIDYANERLWASERHAGARASSARPNKLVP
jgi:hypothetical protein